MAVFRHLIFIQKPVSVHLLPRPLPQCALTSSPVSLFLGSRKLQELGSLLGRSCC